VVPSQATFSQRVAVGTSHAPEPRKVGGGRDEPGTGLEEANEGLGAPLLRECHSDPIHKNLEADIRALHRPLLRAKVPGIPKDPQLTAPAL
jgi:hypothetical protein